MSKISYEYQKSFAFGRYFEHQLNNFFDWLETATGNNHHQGDSSNFSYNGGAKMTGAFQPFADMYKDFRDAFTAYKAPYQKQNNLMQPLRGLGNIIKSVGILIGTLLFFLVNTILLVSKDRPVTMRQNLYQTSVWLIEGISTMLRGLTQLCATPLVYLFETPMRMLITKIKGERKIEENNGIHRMIKDGLNIMTNANGRFWYSDGQSLSKTLLNIHHNKFNVSRNSKHQKTDINAELESKLFREAYYAGDTDSGYKKKVELSLRYFSLFKTITLSPNELEIIRERIGEPEFNYPAISINK